MKRLMVLSLVSVMSLSAAIEKRAVYVNLGGLFERSKAGIALQREDSSLQKEIREMVEKEQAKLAELDKKGDKAAFAAEELHAKHVLEEKQHAGIEKLQAKAKELQSTIMSEVQKVAKAEGWCSVSDAGTCLYFDADLDQTEKVLAVLNKAHDEQVAKAAVAKQS